jgi:hypothetical protein
MGRRDANTVGSGSSRLLGADYVATDVDHPVCVDRSRESIRAPTRAWCVKRP